jgi:geranylgeranyl pyrophosphate synthase
MITAREDTSTFAAFMDERARILDYMARHLQETVGETPGFLAKTSDYVLSTPGKLLRPLLLLDACRAAGGDPERVIPAAAGTEFGHIASLVHDDIIDGDSTRRGQATLHVKHGLAAAILTGDLLIFQTFLTYTQCHERGVSAEHVLAAIRTLSTTCIEMCQGQALEATIAGQLETTEQTYLRMIGLKTANVCRAAARIGALLAGGSEQAVDALGRYGDNLGMAFQIIDDILSYEGSAPLVGKALSSDVRNRRVTLPVIYALQSEPPQVRERIGALFTAQTGDGTDAHAELVQILTVARALDRARALASRFTAQAKQQLDLLPDSEPRERLRALADIVCSRDH